MGKIYSVTYQNENMKKPGHFIVRFAEVGANDLKQAREIFKRTHSETDKIIQIRFKRNGGRK